MKSINVSCGQNVEYFSAVRGDALKKTHSFKRLHECRSQTFQYPLLLLNGYVNLNNLTISLR